MKPQPKDDIRIIRPDRLQDIGLLTGSIYKVVYRPHTHDEYAIGVVESGVQTFREPGGAYPAPPGTIFTLNPGDVHAGEAAEETGYRYRLAYLPQDFIKKSLENDVGVTQGTPYLKHRLTNDSKLSKNLYHLLSTMAEPSACSVKSESELVIFLRSLFHRHGEYRADEMPDTDMNPVRRVTDMIKSRFAEPVTLSEMATLAGLSKYHFIRVFQSKTGLSPHAYLTQTRVAKARSAIESGVSLAEAAFASGFSDQSHMSRYFKSTYGITPGRFSRMC